MYEYKYDKSKYKPDPLNLCPTCKGQGYSDSGPEIYHCAPVIKGKKVVALGSGCPICKGIGKII